MKGVVSARRRSQAKKHARQAHTCSCGTVVYGNGGWRSHRRACQKKRREQAEPEQAEGPPESGGSTSVAPIKETR